MKLFICLGLSAVLSNAAAAAAERIDIGPPEKWVDPATIPQDGAPTQTPLKVLLMDRELRFTGRAEEMYVESAIKVQTAQGLEGAGTFTVVWNPDTDQVTMHKLQILRNDQRIDVLATQKFTVARRETNLGYAALDGRLTGVIQPAGLQVGDVIDFAYTLRHADPVLAGTSEGVIGGFGIAPISRLRVRAQWPSDEPIHWRASDGLMATQTTREGLTLISVDADSLQPVVQPQGAPAQYVVDPRIEFSSFASWGDVAARLAPLYERAAAIESDSPLNAEVARIRASSPDPKVRAAMALALVESQVRYVFLGMNDGGLIPATPDLTWSRRFGDCKAKTVLLTALLRSLGIDATPVAVGTQFGALLPTRLPMVELFNHVLVRSVIDGKTYWLDGTRLGDSSLEKLPVPYYHWALPLLPHASELAKVVPPPPSDPLMDTAVRIDATAGITRPAAFHAEMILRGDAALATKLGLANLAPNQLDQSLRQYWTRLYGFVTVKTVSASYDDASATEHLTLDGVAQMDWGGDQYEADGMGVGYQANFDRTPGPNQNAPYAVAYPYYTRVRETIQLPDDGAGFALDGKDIDRTVAGVEYHRHASLAQGVFTGEATARSVVTEFPASEARADEQALREMAKSTLHVDSPKGYSPTAADRAAGIPDTTSIKDAVGFATRGYSLIRRGRLDDAIADLDVALALDPRNAPAIAERAMSYARKHDFADAERDLQIATGINPHDKFVLYARGFLAFDKSDFQAAVDAYTGVLKIDPKDVYALQMRAESNSVLDRQAALADLDEAIKLAPTQADLYWYRARVMRSLKMKEAVLQPELLIKADPQNAAVYRMASDIYAMLGDSKQAREAVDRSIQMTPTEDAYLTRARQRAASDLEGRRADLESAAGLNPGSARTLALLAQTDLEAGDYAEAISVANRAISVSGETPQLLTIRAVGYFKTNQVKLAEQDLAKATQAQDAVSLNNACWAMATADVELDRALTLCNDAIAKGTGTAKAAYFDSLGLVLLRLGRCKDAITAYDSALSIRPLQPASLYGRGVCELRVGDREDGTKDVHDAKLFSDGAVAVEFKRYGLMESDTRMRRPDDKAARATAQLTNVSR